MQPHSLRCNAVSYSYPSRQVLNQISFKAEAGEFIGLIGPNGAGKSTLLKLLLGLEKGERGEITINGLPLAKMPRNEIAKQIALVPQDLSIDFAFSVREIVAMGRNPYLGSYQTEGKQDQQIIADALQRADLIELADRPIDQLSGGERQRVFIARALAQQSKILLLDEPTASLDLSHQLEVMLLLRELVDEGYLVIAAIHDLELAARFCDRLTLLSAGGVVAEGQPEEVLNTGNLLRYFSVNSEISHDNDELRIRLLSPSS